MISYSKLPRAGIGNKMFVWAQGYVFAKKNNCRHITLGWIKIHIGPLLRKEKSTRLYLGYFDSKKMVSSLIFYLLNLLRVKIYLNQKDCCEVMDGSAMYTFKELPIENDYFLVLKNYREEIRKGFLDYLHKSIYEKYIILDSPEIGVHIRLGDFKLANMNESMDFFIGIINELRTKYKKNLKVTVFSDGNLLELEPILKLNNVVLANHEKDLLELLHLSKSKILVLSSRSTFSQWAGFFSNGILIYDKNIVTTKIRVEKDLLELDFSEIETLKFESSNF